MSFKQVYLSSTLRHRCYTMSLSKSSSKHQTVVAVFPESKEGLLALEALKMGAAELKHTTVERLPFDRLDFGETAS